MDLTTLYLVAEHLPASPTLFCKLQQVSLDFRKVFSSDQVWERLNVYGVQNGIYDHFVKSSQKYQESMLLAWGSNSLGYRDLQRLQEAGETNLYVKLAQLLKQREHAHISDKQLLLKFLALNRLEPFVHSVDPKLASDKQVGLEAVKYNGAHLAWLGNDLQDDKEIVLMAVSSEKPSDKWYNDTLTWASARLMTDREVVLRAVSSGPTVIPPQLSQDEEITKAAFYWDPESVAYFIFGGVQTLEFKLKYQSDDHAIVECMGKSALPANRGEFITLPFLITETNAPEVIQWTTEEHNTKLGFSKWLQEQAKRPTQRRPHTLQRV